MKSPILSIITPVYQVEPYLRACLDSILTQSFPDFELLLIDDGSTDGSESVCDEYASKDDRIRVIHQKNGGLSEARNRGLDLARGEYVAFVDSDDTLSENLLLENMRIIGRDPSIDILEFPVFVYFGAPEGKLWRPRPESFRSAPFVSWFRKTGYRHSYACNKLFRKSLFDKIRFPGGRFFEDIYILPLLMKAATHYHLSDRGIYYYHARSGSISRTRSEKQYRDLFDSHYRLWEIARIQEELSEEAAAFSLEMADWLISLGRCDLQQARTFCQAYRNPDVSWRQLWTLPLSFSRKIKSIPLVLGGLKCQLEICCRLKQTNTPEL